MAGGQDYSRYQRGIINRYYEHADTIALQRLSEIVSDLYLAEGNKANQLWKSAGIALEKLTQPDDARVAKVMKDKSVTGLAKLVGDLSASAQSSARKTSAKKDDDLGPTVPSPAQAPLGGTRPSTQPTPTPLAASQSNSSVPTPDQLKAAMKAFRKRLKLTKLDEESKISNRAMTAGRKSAVVAIMPPREYPQAVWDELVKEGKLKDAGRGFYELAE